MKKIKSIVLAVVAVFVAVVHTQLGDVVHAQSASMSWISRKNYVINPGESIKDKLTITNLDKSNPLDVSMRIVDFTYTEDSGKAKFFLDPEAPQTTWSLKPYMKIPDKLSVSKDGSKSFDIEIEIPKGHGAGSYYSAIIYSTSAPNGGNVGLSASSATLVFVQIPGKVHEDLQLKRLGAYDTIAAQAGKDDGYRFLNFYEPQTIGYTLKNNGNVTEAPVGSITLKHMFGQEIVITDINPNRSLALIGQTRTFAACIKQRQQQVDFAGSKTEAKQCIPPGLWPGLYTVSIEAFYGQNGNNTREVTGTATFWYLPPWFLLLLAILILIAIYYIRKAKRAIERRRNGQVKFKKSHHKH